MSKQYELKRIGELTAETQFTAETLVDMLEQGWEFLGLLHTFTSPPEWYFRRRITLTDQTTKRVKAVARAAATGTTALWNLVLAPVRNLAWALMKMQWGK